MTLIEVLLAIFLPPVAAFLKAGLGAQFWINVLLTLLGDLPDAVRAGAAAAPVGLPVAPSALASGGAVTLRQSKAEAEVRRIGEALQRHGNNRLRAAAELGISRMGLYKKLHKHGLMAGV